MILRSKFAMQAEKGFGKARREDMKAANAKLNMIIDDVDAFIERFLPLSGTFNQPPERFVGAQ